MIFDKFDEYDDLVQVFRGYFSVQIQDIVDILQDNLYNRGFAIEEIKSIFYRLQLKLLNLTEDLFVYLNIHNDDKLRQEMKNVLRDIFILRINLKFSNGDRKIIIDEIEKQFKTIEK